PGRAALEIKQAATRRFVGVSQPGGERRGEIDLLGERAGVRDVRGGRDRKSGQGRVAGHIHGAGDGASGKVALNAEYQAPRDLKIAPALQAAKAVDAVDREPRDNHRHRGRRPKGAGNEVVDELTVGRGGGQAEAKMKADMAAGP